MKVTHILATLFFYAFCSAVMWEHWNNTSRWDFLDYVFALLVTLTAVVLTVAAIS